MPTPSKQLATRLWLPVITVLSTGMVLTTHRRWAHTIVDFGRELYVPWQMAEGRALYHELAYVNGPLSPSFNALVFQVFGVSLTSILLVNAAILLAITLLLRRLLRRVTDEWSVLLASSVFVLVFAFAQTNRYANNNFLCPYSHEMTHGLLLGLLSLEAMVCFLASRQMRWCALAGFSLGLAFLTKPEMFVASLSVCVAGLVGDTICYRESPGAKVRVWLSLLAASAVAPVIAWIALSTRMPMYEAADGILRALRNIIDLRVAKLPLYKAIMGTDDLAKSLTLLGAGLSVTVMMAVVAAVAGYGASRLASGRARAFAAVIACALVTALLFVVAEQELWAVTARTLPVIVLGTLVTAGIGTLWASTDSETWRRRAACMLCSVYSLALLAKILLNAGPQGYGFVLAAPAAMLATVVAFDWVPRTIQPRGVSLAVFRGVALGAMLVATWSYVDTTRGFAEARTVVVGSGSDRLYARPETAAVVNGLLDAVAVEAEPADTLAVLPEGALLNFLTRRPNPTPHVTLIGGILYYGEERVLIDYEARPPDLVVVLPRDLSEYGWAGFGKDFGVSLWSWLQDEYEQVASVPGADWQEPAVLMRRKIR